MPLLVSYPASIVLSAPRPNCIAPTCHNKYIIVSEVIVSIAHLPHATQHNRCCDFRPNLRDAPRPVPPIGPWVARRPVPSAHEYPHTAPARLWRAKPRRDGRRPGRWAEALPRERQRDSTFDMLPRPHSPPRGAPRPRRGRRRGPGRTPAHTGLPVVGSRGCWVLPTWTRGRSLIQAPSPGKLRARP